MTDLEVAGVPTAGRGSEPIGSSASAGAVLRRALIAAIERVVRHEAGIGVGDPESIHQARVGLRTTRSHLRTFAPLIHPSWAAMIDPELVELVELADALGRVRDLDVLSARLEASARDLRPIIDPLFDDLAARRERALAELLERVRDGDHAALVGRLATAIGAPVMVEAAARPAAEELPRHFRRAWRRLARAADALGPGSPPGEHHAARIRAKRARYAAAAIAPALQRAHRRDAVRLADELAAIQGLLGALQDATVAREEILAAAARRSADGPFNLAAGILLERQAVAAAEARDGFPDAWRRARRGRLRRWTKRRHGAVR